MTVLHRIVVLLLALAAASAGAQEQLVFKADYEDRSVNSGVAGLVADGPAAKDALQVDCTVARSGKCSVATRLRMDPSYISAGAHRSETSSSRVPGTLYSPGDRFRYKFSLLISPEWKTDARNAIDMVWQFKRFGTHPDMMVAIKGETLVWRITETRQVTLTKSLPLGEWVDFDFTVKWSTGADGQADLTFTRANSGQKETFSHSGPNLRDGKARGGYLKWGLYKPGQKTRGEAFPPELVHHDDIAVWRLQ